jgi:hypothetical protein
MLQTIKKTTFKKVQDILSSFPDTRNDDRLLCLTYWKQIDKVEDLDGIQFATTPEAIRRARQLLNAKGILQATNEDVLKRRRKGSNEMKAGIANI